MTPLTQSVPYGTCHCGCGGKTAIALYAVTRYGVRKGEHRKFIQGHYFKNSAIAEYLIEDRGYETPCWIWQKCTKAKGYGARIYSKKDGGDGKTYPAHKVYWMMKHGASIPGMDIHHLCRIKACVNPDHLQALAHVEHCIITRKEDDHRGKLTHCKHGHPFDAENTVIRKDGMRRCKPCSVLRYYWRNKP